jgi:ABC-type dipeptide/oligopeptide/nickel transport systems, permease components
MAAVYLASYVVRRILLAVPTILGVTILVFFMIHLVPGDPAVTLLGPRATPELIARLHHTWGLDRPLLQQYGLFMDRLVHGNLGQSFFYQLPARTLIASRMGATVLLLVMATLFTVVVTIPLAIIAAIRRDKWLDHLVRSVPAVTLGMPSFWVGIMLILVFGVRLGVLPVGGYGVTFPQHLESLLLPALTIAVAISPMTIRSLRSSMIDVLEADYIRTAKAKGVAPARVLVRHALRNALIPMITVLSVNIGWMVGGTVIVEHVFALPGIGGLMLDAIANRDFALVQAITLVFAILVILVYLIADVSYSLIDPRVRFD